MFYLHFIKSLKFHTCYTESCIFFLHLSFSDSWVTRHYNMPDLGCSSKGLRNIGLG